MVCQRHVVQAVVLGGRGRGVGQAVGLVGQAVGGAEALPGADRARPLAGVLRVHAVPLEAVLFGSADTHKEEGRG